MIRTKPDAPRRRRFPLIILVPIFAFIALLSWGMSSPLGSSPDDDFHLASTWCGLGERPGVCEDVPLHPHQRAVPVEASNPRACFAHISIQSAACQAATFQEGPSMVPVTRGNFYGNSYPPAYYWFTSIFVGPNVIISALIMRAVNALLFVGLGTLLYLLLPVARRKTLVWSLAISIIPLGMFLLASNNPSAWAIISGGMLWLALVGFFESSGRRKIGLGAIAAVTAVMGSGARSDAAVYSVIAVVVAIVLTFRKERLKDRNYYLSGILPVAIVIVSGLFYLSAGQSGLAGGFSTLGNKTGTLTLLWQNFVDLPGLWTGALGTWGIGWLDTPMPALVTALTISTYAAAGFFGLVSMSVRKLISMVIVAGALWFIPIYILTRSHVTVGEQVQPRYIMPLLVMLGGVLLFEVLGKRIAFTRAQIVLAAAALSIANSIALHVNLERYLTGLDINGFNLNHNVEWWWNAFPLSPMAVWALGSATFAGAVFIGLWVVSRARETTLEPSIDKPPLLVG